jgi:gliding motility-associated-like protein
MLTVTPPDGACPAVAEARVFVFFPDCAEPYVFVPNAFSPNDDNVNDVLYVRGPIKELHFVIYNRWGEKMFETFDATTGWDGYLATTPLPPDVYGYYLEVTCFDDKKFFKKGNVSLIR